MLAFLLSGCSKYDEVRKSLDFLKTDSFQCDVVWVIYGDMFYCQLSDREIEKIKLIGVEVPKVLRKKRQDLRNLFLRGELW